MDGLMCMERTPYPSPEHVPWDDLIAACPLPRHAHKLFRWHRSKLMIKSYNLCLASYYVLRKKKYMQVILFDAGANETSKDMSGSQIRLECTSTTPFVRCSFRYSRNVLNEIKNNWFIAYSKRN
jgi:hypothetical protein